MKKRLLNYRIIVTPDVQTGTNKPGYTAYCPVLGLADDGDTIEEAIGSLNGAIQAYIDSLVEDGLPVPMDNPDHDMVTTTQIEAPPTLQPA